MNILIVSPFFPPVNTPDLHRIRQLLPYLKENGCNTSVICINEKDIAFNKEENLLRTLPSNIEVLKVKQSTSLIYELLGVNNPSIKTLLPMFFTLRKKLRKEKFDLIFFSTTSFPTTIIGRALGARYSIPYVIDMQDPWRSDHYLGMPKKQRPSKFYLSYIFDTILEWYCMQKVSGILSVNTKYIQTLKNRYTSLVKVPSLTMPFGYSEIDFKISEELEIKTPSFDASKINFVYMGRVNNGMIHACEILFRVIQLGLEKHNSVFKNVKLYFIGTSYANKSDASSHVDQIALKYLPKDMIEVYPDRIGYLDSLTTMRMSDILFMPGSTDGDYIASKALNVVYLNKKVFAVSNSNSEVVNLIGKLDNHLQVFLNDEKEVDFYNHTLEKLLNLINQTTVTTKNDKIEEYSARNQAKELVGFFNKVINVKA